MVKANGKLFPWIPDLKATSKNLIPVISNPCSSNTRRKRQAINW